MVRPKWRSPTCETCRMRKIKCDKGGPECDNCLRTGRLCQRPYHAGNLSHIPASTRPKPDATSALAPVTMLSPLQIDMKYPPYLLEDMTVQELDFQKTRVKDTTLNNWLITPSVTCIHQAQVLSHFVDEYIPKQTQKADAHQTFSWFEFVPLQHGRWQLMDISLGALSLIFLGTKYGDKNLIIESRKQYSRLVWKVSMIRRNSEDIIAIAAVLSMYELYNTSRVINSWMVHVRAACRLIKERGPHQSIDPRLLCLIRTLAFYDGCGRRKASFMAEREWRDMAPREELFEQVLDISLTLPTVQEYRDRIQSYAVYSPTELRKSFYQFVKVFKDTYTQLRHWYLGFLDSQTNCPFSKRRARPSELSFLDDHQYLKDVFPDIFEFLDKHQWQLLLLSWTGFFILFWEALEVMRTLNTIIEFECTPTPWNPDYSKPNRPWLDIECDLTDLPWCPGQDVQTAIQEVEAATELFAGRICQSMAFCDQYPYGSSIKLPTLSPLWIARQFFKDRSNKRHSWCGVVLKCFQAKDVGFGLLLAKMTYADYRKLEGITYVAT